MYSSGGCFACAHQAANNSDATFEGPRLGPWWKMGLSKVPDGRQKHIGRLLETARKIRGLTADLVAEHCNVTRGRVYQWEKEKFVLPKNLPALSAVLHVPLGMLVSENGQRVSKKPSLSKIKQLWRIAA